MGPEIVSLVLGRPGAAANVSASVADVQAWAGITRLGEVAASMDLRRYRDPDGRELLDLPELTVPAEDVPAPPRLLGPFDQTILSYADRTRVIVRIVDISLIPSPSFPSSQPRMPRSSSSAVGSDLVPILFFSLEIVTPLSSVPPTVPVADTTRDGLCRLIGA